MSHNYLLDIYQRVDQRLLSEAAALTEYEAGQFGRRFSEGRIQALNSFKAYLSRNFDEKLPRRIYKQLCLQRVFSQNAETQTNTDSRMP
ncbi:MAG: hypothetical protein C0403_02975 [Desulfobacterium sp.]|nr:hypothetical protein [Desulfobacterium sp.]